MGETPIGIRRIDCGYRRRLILVRSTSVFPRRTLMKRKIVLSLLLSLGALSIAAASFQNPPAGQRRGEGRGQQGQQAQQPLEIQKVKDNLYMIVGNGGNTAAFINEGGVVGVDTKKPGNGQGVFGKNKKGNNETVHNVI